jgi:hypothetical protein
MLLISESGKSQLKTITQISFSSNNQFKYNIDIYHIYMILYNKFNPNFMFGQLSAQPQNTGDTPSVDPIGTKIRRHLADLLGHGAEKRELGREDASVLIGTLMSRFELSGDKKLSEALSRVDAEKSLREASPEDLFSIHKLEEIGGEPAIVRVEGDEIIIETRSKEAPLGSRNMTFDQADKQRKSFGPNVKFQSRNSYENMNIGLQPTEIFDPTTWNWLETDVETRKTGEAIRGHRVGDGSRTYKYNAKYHSEKGGWRGSIRIKIKKASN